MNTIDIQALLNIAVVGAVLSVIIEAIGQFFATSPAVTKAVTVGLCIAVGSAYVWLQSTPYLATVLTVLAASSTVYAFVFNRKP